MQRIRTDILAKIIKDNIPMSADVSEVENYLNHAFYEDKVKFLNKDGKFIGFITWDAWGVEEGTDLNIIYLIILPQYKGSFFLKELQKFFQEKYPDLHRVYGFSSKKNTDVSYSLNNSLSALTK